MRPLPSVAPALAAASVLAIAAAAPAVAQPQPAWPAKPLRLIVPQSAGGSTDLVARPLAPHHAPALGENVRVDNPPRAGRGLGTASGARGAPDRPT
ncbi:MAG: tripartite tricarboxylate transporter substrate binding protein, partial [bacterium]